MLYQKWWPKFWNFLKSLTILQTQNLRVFSLYFFLTTIFLVSCLIFFHKFFFSLVLLNNQCFDFFFKFFDFIIGININLPSIMYVKKGSCRAGILLTFSKIQPKNTRFFTQKLTYLKNDALPQNEILFINLVHFYL